MKWGGSNKAGFGEEGIRNRSDQNHYMNTSNSQTIKSKFSRIYLLYLYLYMYVHNNNSHFERE